MKKTKRVLSIILIATMIFATIVEMAVFAENESTPETDQGIENDQKKEDLPESNKNEEDVDSPSDTEDFSQESIESEKTDLDKMQEPIETFNEESELPSLKTVAYDKADGDNLMEIGHDEIIVDFVCYKGLKVGVEYRLTAFVIDKESGDYLESQDPALEEAQEPETNDNKEAYINVSIDFVPEEENGYKEIEIPVDTTKYFGRDLVIYERLSLSEEDTTVVWHDDLSDNDQTVIVPNPQIDTCAIDKTDGDKVLAWNENVTIIDSISYSELTPGETYTAIGIIMDKETSEPILVNGKPVTGETTFTTDKEEGSVEVLFTFGTYDLSNKDLVVYETLSLNNEVIVIHENIDDEGQSLHVSAATTIDDGVGTGDMGILIILFITAVPVSSLFVLLFLNDVRRNA